MKEKQWQPVDLGVFPDGTKTITVSLQVCSHFESESHFSWYRYSTIARHFIPDNSGIFTVDKLFDVMQKYFGYNSKHALENKLLLCVGKSEIPFMQKLDKETYKANSNKYLLRYFQDFKDYTIKIPMYVLQLQRAHYITYIKLCMGQTLEYRTDGLLEKALSPFAIPSVAETPKIDDCRQ